MYKQCINYDRTIAPCIIRLSDKFVIPFALDNTDYQAFLKYKEEGGKVYGPDEEVPSGQTSE
jgi:hypothetical protein